MTVAARMLSTRIASRAKIKAKPRCDALLFVCLFMTNCFLPRGFFPRARQYAVTFAGAA